MVSRKTTQLLRWHAGLDGDALDARSVSGSLAAGGNVEYAMSDFIEAVERLNEEMNGAQPSAAVEGKEDYISRDVAYAVAEVSRMIPRRRPYHRCVGCRRHGTPFWRATLTTWQSTSKLRNGHDRQI